jgi:hypothetical protein
MSSLGAMLVRHIERDGKVGLEYIVFECIVERYSSQDNIEVLGVRVRSSKFATFLTFHYNQRTQPDRLEETPHSRLDIRVSRRHSLPRQANLDRRSSRLPFLLGPHFVVSLRQRKLTIPIYTQKVDWFKAYRLVQLLSKRGIEMRNSVRRPSACPLRLTSSGASNASEFCNCSETVCSIANELLHCEDLDPS